MGKFHGGFEIGFVCIDDAVDFESGFFDRFEIFVQVGMIFGTKLCAVETNFPEHGKLFHQRKFWCFHHAEFDGFLDSPCEFGLCDSGRSGRSSLRGSLCEQ